MSKHTPGPWVASKVTDNRKITVKAGLSSVALVSIGNVNHLANARLIAAAPELLELLQYLMEIRDQCFIPNDGNWWDNKTRAVIAKATGENK